MNTNIKIDDTIQHTLGSMRNRLLSSASLTIVPYCVSIVLSVTDLQIMLGMSTGFKPSRDN